MFTQGRKENIKRERGGIRIHTHTIIILKRRREKMFNFLDRSFVIANGLGNYLHD